MALNRRSFGFVEYVLRAQSTDPTAQRATRGETGETGETPEEQGEGRAWPRCGASLASRSHDVSQSAVGPAACRCVAVVGTMRSRSGALRAAVPRPTPPDPALPTVLREKAPQVEVPRSPACASLYCRPTVRWSALFAVNSKYKNEATLPPTLLNFSKSIPTRSQLFKI